MARRPYVFQEYPKMVWHPETGDFKVAAGPGDVPAGWLTRHPADPVHAAPDDEGVVKVDKAGIIVPKYSEDDRRGIIQALKDRGVSFNSRAPTPALLAVLNGLPR